MGAEIAFVHALKGLDVLLADRSGETLDRAMSRLATIYDKGAARGHHDIHGKDAVLGAISTTEDLGDFTDRDFVVEAVFERHDTKRDVLAKLNEVCKEDCLIATNTSTIPITVLASHLDESRRPRFVGTHYFSPVSRMKLVEVIPGAETSSETVSRIIDLCASVGKQPIRVKDVTGFAVNRLLHVMMIEAVRLVEEEVATPEEIDLACKLGLGHPMGPFELMDATTSSLCLEAQQIMFDAYGERFRPRPLLKQRVQAGFVGGREKKGWHA